MSQRYIGGVVTETTNVAQSPWTGEWTQQAALQGFAGAQAPLKVANSLRFRSSASAYLNRTPSVAGNRQTWTWSGWGKLGAISVARSLFSAGADGSNYTSIDWRADNRIQLFSNTAGLIVGSIVWDPYVWRDPSAWYHVVIVCDTTNASQTSRYRFYMNGVQYTGISSTSGENNWPTQNANTNINNTVAHSLGRKQHNASEYFDGYLAEVNFIDGQALPPTAFGTFSKENGVWSPITYTGTYGTNGFRLNFSNGTSTTTLGYDSSGNGNNWTTNNISLTAGSTYDWMIDSPTKYPGSSYGVGNYAVLNPLDNGGNTLSNGNLKAVCGANFLTRSSVGMTSGKFYMEFTVDAVGTSSAVGIATRQASLSIFLGQDAYSWSYIQTGQKYTNNTGAAYGASYTTNDIIGVAFDADSGTLTFYKNGASQGSAFTGLTSGPYFFALGANTPTLTANFGQRPFAYTPPSGYKSLCAFNLPGPTINNGASYMAATLYTGTGATQTLSNAVNGVSFQPDFVWVKSRSNTWGHSLADSVRGTTKFLQSNTTGSETTSAGNVTAFTSSGFSIGNDGVLNNNADTYVGWQWKAGGTAVTNTAGSITSSVSANTTSGFSVVTYTGNNTAGATVGHGLGVAPSMIIVKSRATSSYWFVYHVALGATQYLSLNATDAAGSTVTLWNNTAPTSSVITLGTNSGSNNSGTMVAYCFAAIPGYSAFGSYTGNGSSDGPFVYCGFRPRYVLIKRTDTTADWVIWDTARNPYNAATSNLYPDLANAEYTDPSVAIDFVASGFKLRNTNIARNASGGTYIYAAFAENPFQNALAR